MAVIHTQDFTMRFALQTLAAGTVLALLTACAPMAPAGPAPTQALLTYETSPEGATLFEGGVALGQEPVTRTYKASAPGATITTPEVTAVWPSGAKATFWTQLQPGADELATLVRPPQAPDLKKDQAHADKVLEARRKDDKRSFEELRRERARNSAACKAELSGQSGASSCQ